MDNLTITIRDFHIRYEDVTSNPSTPFTFGVLLESFCIETTDEHGTKVFVDRSEAPPDKMHKVATLKNLTVYWDRLSRSTSLQTSNTFAASMRSVIYSDFKQLDRRWLLLPPCSLSVRFTKNESQVFTKESPKYRIQSTVRSFALHLSREQYDEMVFMYLAMRSRLAIEAHFWYNRHRPFLSITNYSIVWWDYLVRFHSKNKKLRFRWSVVRKLARDRKMYMALYKQHHLQHIPLTVEQLAYLQRLEDMFPIELTLRLRDVADAQFAKTKSDAVSSSSWFGYFFGEGGESSKDVQQDVLSAEGKADLKRAFEETAALELAPVPDDCCIVVLDLTLQMGQVGLFAYQNVPLLTSEFTGSCLFQVQPASRWLAQMQLRRLNVFNWRCADASAAGRLFCTLQVDDGGSDKKAPFEVSVAATDATGMRVRVSAEPIRVVLDAVFLLQLADFFSTHDTLNDVWAYATSSVQSYVFAEHEADMRAAAVVATNKNIVYDVLVDMKAPLVVLPEDPTAAHTSMVVLDLGRFHVRDVPTAAASATVYAWQIDMTNIEVLLQQQHSSKPGVPIVPGFSVGFAVETSRNLQDTRIPYVMAKASMPSVVVNVGQETIVALGTLHARLLNQCQRYIKATSKPDMASFAPEKGDVETATDLSVVRLAPQEQASVKFHLTWVVECVHVNIDESFRIIMHGTWFDYQASSAATTTIRAKLQDLCMEDKCYAPSSPYFYLARTQDSTDLIQLTIATSDAPTRHADVTVDVHFNVLHLQWNPPSIMMLYTMISAYGSSMDDGACAGMMVDMSSSSLLSQSTLLLVPTSPPTTTSTIPALKITASLKQFSISFNKDVLDRRLLTLTVTDASVVYVGEHSGQYNVKGELGDVSGVDSSVVKAPKYSPFFGMDRTAHGCFKQEGGRSPKLVVFEYAVQGGAMLPRLALVLDSIRIVYFHQQVLELVDYLFQGILGTLVNQTLLSATQLIMEPATTLILDIRIHRPKILIPMDPLDVEHFLLQSSRLQVHHTPSTLASYCCGSSLLERVTTATTTSHTLPCDFKQVVLEQAGLYSTDGRGGYDNLMATPLTLDISILDIYSTRLKDDDGSTALPRFSIDCVMPHMHVHMSRTHYLMFFRMLSDNIGGASLYQSVAVDDDDDMIMAKSEMAHRPVVVYEYANADLEGATMAVSFRMESFSCCALDIGLTLETTNLTVCLRLLNHINPSLDVSLANAFISDDLLRCESVVTIRYEWSNASDDAGLLLGTSSTLDVALNHLHGKLIPHVLSDISRFFAMDADATAVHDDVTTRPCSEPAAQSLAKTPTSFTMNVLATNVQLSLPQSLTDKQPTVELVVAANFNVALESFANHADNLDQKLTLQARDLEALLQNANRQGCSDTLVQLIEPTTVGVTYLGFQHACHHQDKVDVTVSPVEVFLSYEDMRVLADVWTTMQHDMAPAFPSSGPTSATTLSSSKTLPLVADSEVQRHVTVDVQRMQLTLINDCDGCDMGLVQLELPTCRVFLNATTTHDATTATGGGDISFASSYYNPDSRVWHPLCPEWKVHASAMTNIPHAPTTTDQFKSMQWNISADTLHVTATHGLLEALASAGGTLIKSKQLDQTKHDAPCLIQNESGLPIEYWWSSDPSAKTRVQHKAADNIHYVHVKGKGSGVTRTYTSNDKEHGTLCINFVGMDTKPVQGIVVDQLGTRPHALVETCGSLSKLRFEDFYFAVSL
ncbi:hypothetical protein B5M09_006227 [Aphanomyces astaci]|uniref:Chorein N-terminal domain-containing protein n=1 Tax=Aphanomyces astaci TaxID=112090 RepID=A0A425C3V5_APHAT|nr:hypothetical protein B5M09_006227 [Aphanomyces astaci]